MKSIGLNPLIGVMFLIILICAGIWLYTEWDLKRFDESLPELPTVKVSQEGSLRPQAALPQGATEGSEDAKGHPSRPEPEAERVEPQNVDSPESVTVDETQYSYETSFDTASGEYDDGTEADSLASGDATDVPQEEPYDIEIVEAGFDDYNAFLATDPAYAYQRLDDALREQYGDDPDVDILVEHTRRCNEGTTTLDSIIENNEAQLRLLVKNNYPGQQELQDSLEVHREMKQMSLEAGREIKITSYTIIETGRN